MEIGIALISAIGGILIALVSQRYRKQESLDTEQQRLVQTLQDLVEAQDSKIENLESLVAAGTAQIKLLRSQVEELREVIVSQALLIEELVKNK